MEEQRKVPQPQQPGRRKKRSKLQIFKQDYLPVLIAGAAVLMVLVFLIGSITRAVQRSQYNKNVLAASSAAESVRLEQLSNEAESILAQAADLVRGFDYPGAIRLLEGFSGSTQEFPQITEALTQYCAERDALVLWDDPQKVINLSFQLLIADPQRAFRDETYGSSYFKNFITTNEFLNILHQLYNNGYVLVRTADVTAEDTPSIYLPEGKKPLIITQTNVNYNTYMIDSDADMLPDKGGDGFASRLILDANGNITCEMVDGDGQLVTGAFDLIPILDAFIGTHPDFSYRGARATIALTGYDGLFGYRTNPGAQQWLGDAYQNEIEQAETIAQHLIKSGYELACYTYENKSYAACTPEQIRNDLQKWKDEAEPIIGQTDILVYAQNSDISYDLTPYSGEKFQTLSAFGFRYFSGFCTNAKPYYITGDGYARFGRILVTGHNLLNNGSWFQSILDPAAVLDSSRTTE